MSVGRRWGGTSGITSDDETTTAVNNDRIKTSPDDHTHASPRIRRSKHQQQQPQSKPNYPHVPLFSQVPRFGGGGRVTPPPGERSTYTPSGRRIDLKPGETLNEYRSRSKSRERARRQQQQHQQQNRSIHDDDEDPGGPRASDYETMRESIEALHLRNLAAKAAAQARADASQAEMRQNQEAVSLACAHLESGLESVEGNFEARLDEYEQLLSSRTEVARSLNLQLRKRSKYSHGGVGGGGGLGGGGGSSEETMESILDALSNWFVTRSSRALNEDPFLSEEEQEIFRFLEDLQHCGGSEGIVTKIFQEIRFTPMLQQQLMKRLKQTTEKEIEMEEHEKRYLVEELQRLRTKLGQDQQRIRELEGGGISNEKSSNSSGTTTDSNSKVSSSSKVGGSSGNGGNNVELETLLKKKLKQLVEQEKKRLKLVSQLAASTKVALDKDRVIEGMSQQITKLNLELNAAQREAQGLGIIGSINGVVAGVGGSSHKDTLTKELMIRSSQQAEEYGILKLFLMHTLWEREDLCRITYSKELDLQIERIRSCFEQFTPDSACQDVISKSQLQRFLQGHINFVTPTPTPTSTTTTALALGQSTPTPSIPTPTSIDFTPVLNLIGSISPEPELLPYVIRSGDLLHAHGGPPRRHMRTDSAKFGFATLLNPSPTSAAAGSVGSSFSSPAAASAASSDQIGFAHFLSFILRYHPYERCLEHSRLCRRLRHVFDGLDTNRDGILTILELESAYKKEGIGISKDQLDSVYLCVTTPPPSQIKELEMARQQQQQQQHQQHQPHRRQSYLARGGRHSPDLDDDAHAYASKLDAQLHRPLDFVAFLSLFSLNSLREIFDRCSSSSSNGVSIESSQENHEGTVGGVTIIHNLARRRHDSWIVKEKMRLAELTKSTASSSSSRNNKAQSASSSSSAATAGSGASSTTPFGLKSRKPLKPLSLQPPLQQPQPPKTGNEELDRLTSAAAHPEIPNESAPYFTAGTKDVLLHLLSFDSDAFPHDSINLLTLDPSYETSSRSHLSTNLNERVAQSLLQPSMNMKTMLEMETMKAHIELLKGKLQQKRRNIIAAATTASSTSGVTSSNDGDHSSYAAATATSSSRNESPKRRPPLGSSASSSTTATTSRPTTSSNDRRTTNRVGAGVTSTRSNKGGPHPSHTNNHTRSSNLPPPPASQTASATSGRPVSPRRATNQPTTATSAPDTTTLVDALANAVAPSSDDHAPSSTSRSATPALEQPHHVSSTLPTAPTVTQDGSSVSQPPASSTKSTKFKTKTRRSTNLSDTLASYNGISPRKTTSSASALPKKSLSRPTSAVPSSTKVTPMRAPSPTPASVTNVTVTMTSIPTATNTSETNVDNDDDTLIDRSLEECDPDLDETAEQVRLEVLEREYLEDQAERRAAAAEAAAAADAIAATIGDTADGLDVPDRSSSVDDTNGDDSTPMPASRQQRQTSRRASINTNEDSMSRGVNERRSTFKKSASIVVPQATTTTTVDRRSFRRSLDDRRSISPIRRPRVITPISSDPSPTRYGRNLIKVDTEDIGCQTEVEQFEDPSHFHREFDPHLFEAMTSTTAPPMMNQQVRTHTDIDENGELITIVDSVIEEEEKQSFHHTLPSSNMTSSNTRQTHDVHDLKKLIDAHTLPNQSNSSSSSLSSSSFDPTRSKDRSELNHLVRTYHDLYETEHQRVLQLERTLRLFTTTNPTNITTTTTTTPRPPIQQRHVHTSLGGSLTARQRPTSSLSTPRAHAPNALASTHGVYQPTPHTAYGELISRRGDGVRNKLLNSTSFLFPQPQIPIQPRPMTAFPRGA